MSEDTTSPRPWVLKPADVWGARIIDNVGHLVTLAAGLRNANDAALIVAAVNAYEGWRPIETAPRDGLTPILAWDRRSVEIIQWSVKKGRWWHSDEDWAETYYYCFTHWQPLPSPPGPGDTGKKGEGNHSGG